MNKGLPVIWVILIVVLALAVGVLGGYYLFKINGGKTTTTTTVPTKTSTATSTVTSTPTPTSTLAETIDTTGWKTIVLSQTESIKYPSTWTITKDESTQSEQMASYKINCNQNKICDYLSEYKIGEWLKGPDPDEGYVMSKEDRAKASAVFKNIYNNQKISDQDLTAISKLSQEVLGYSSEYRTDIKYLASVDGKFRGISFINTRGQDYGISPIYEISVYNPDKNVIINLSTRLYEGQYTEIDKLNAKLKNVATSSLQEVDKEIHQEFEDLVKDNPRSKYSFGTKLDEADQVMKTLNY